MVDSGALDRSEFDRPLAPTRKLAPGPGLPSREVAAHQLARIHRAMIEIVAEEGYKSVKVRDVVRRAEVSTRTFYEHFSSKEDCFLRTFDLVARRATRRLIAAQAGERDWRRRIALIFETFLQELEAEPHGARFALVESRLGGEACLEQAWSAERIFEGMLAECFARVPKGVVVPPLLLEGIVAGIGGVSRNCLLAGKVRELHDASGDLVDWALGYPASGAGELDELDRQSVWRDTTLESRAALAPTAGEEPWSSSGDRSLILDAVAKLSAKSGYAGLTAAGIHAAAGVSRRKFNSHFESVEDCYLEALERRGAAAFAQAARAQAAASSPAGAVYRAIAALCGHIARDPFLTRVCLADEFPPGPHGDRSRKRLIGSVREQLKESAPRGRRQPRLPADATDAAVWSLFHHHVIRNRTQRNQISATLSYLLLVPLVGAQDAVEAVKSEQSG